jgi:prevent-host-death family protein
MQQIGVRELRQHASRYLALVARGERFEVTDRGRPVALIVPVQTDHWHDLVTSGRVLDPTDATDVARETPADYGIDASATLQSLRELER